MTWRKYVNTRLRFPALLAVVSVACQQPTLRAARGIEGAWQIQSIATKDGSGPAIEDPLPNLFLFTAGHYSMVWMPGTESQRVYEERWKPTDAEKLARYDAIVVNSGTYEISDSTLTTHPIVARVPEFMGGRFVYEFRLTDETLQLTMVDEYSYDGVQAPWAAAGGGLVLILTRAER